MSSPKRIRLSALHIEPDTEDVKKSKKLILDWISLEADLSSWTHEQLPAINKHLKTIMDARCGFRVELTHGEMIAHGEGYSNVSLARYLAITGKWRTKWRLFSDNDEDADAFRAMLFDQIEDEFNRHCHSPFELNTIKLMDMYVRFYPLCSDKLCDKILEQTGIPPRTDVTPSVIAETLNKRTLL